MGAIKFLAAPIRTIVRFPLFQFVVVVAVILLLQAADDNSVLGQIYYSLDKLVDYTMRSLSAVFNVKSFTKSWLTTGFWIAYVYVVCWLILLLMRLAIIAVMDLIARSNAFWLRNAIARERGIVAYSAWVPFERIRPANIPQGEWEERFAWPASIFRWCNGSCGGDRLCNRDSGHFRRASGLYAVSGPDLAWGDIKNIAPLAAL